MPIVGTNKELLREIGNNVNNPSTVVNGKTTIATAGNEAIIGEGSLKIGVTVKALSTNTNVVFIGTSGVSSTDGFQLAAGEQIFIPAGNLNRVYLDVTTNGEGVTYIGN